MKDAVLFELASRWERDAKEPEYEAGNAKAAGRREGLRECADGLRMLTQLLGDSGNQSALAKMYFEARGKRIGDVLKG